MYEITIFIPFIASLSFRLHIVVRVMRFYKFIAPHLEKKIYFQ